MLNPAMTEIDVAVAILKSAGAGALARYAEISNEAPCSLPEYFMPAFVAGKLRNAGFTVTLETSFSTLHEWNNGARGRQGRLPRSDRDEAALLRIGQEIGRQKIDMVIFGRGTETDRNKVDFVALVEFKKGFISVDDVEKLNRILPHIDTCGHGIVCGCVHMNNVERYEKETKSANDDWFAQEVVSALSDGNLYFFCGRTFRANNDPR